MRSNKKTYAQMACSVIVKQLLKKEVKSITTSESLILFSEYCKKNNIQCHEHSAVQRALHTLEYVKRIKRDKLTLGLYLKIQ